MTPSLTFKILNNDSSDYAKAISLAKEILCEPLALKFSTSEPVSDKTQICVAGFLEDALVATATLTRDDDKFFLQHVAVAKEMQNKGIGSQLLKFCEEYVAENEARVIYAHARDGQGGGGQGRSVVNFYVKNEYFCGEEEFLEDGLPHKIVWKILVQ